MTETEIVEVSHVIRKDLCFNTKNILSDSLNMIFLHISSQKLNQLQLEYLTDVQMQMIFLKTFLIDLQQINDKNNKFYLFRDVNLVQNVKFILKENQSCEFEDSISALINIIYNNFCQKLAMIIKEPT